MDNDTVQSTSEPLAESCEVKTLVNTLIPRGSISQYNSKLADEKKSIEEAFERIRQQHELDNTRMGKKLFDKNDETDEEGEQLEEEFQKKLLEQGRKFEEKLKQMKEQRQVHPEDHQK